MLSATVENLTLERPPQSTGPATDWTTIIGNSAANQLVGGAGNDTYVIGSGDTVVEGINAGSILFRVP